MAPVRGAGREAVEAMSDETKPPARWRQGRHYPIHVYESDRPVATFLREEDARRACVAVDPQTTQDLLALQLTGDERATVASLCDDAADGNIEALRAGRYRRLAHKLRGTMASGGSEKAGDDHECGRWDRLTWIMDNIIANGGTFKPGYLR